jgi:hypothetical protein
VCAYVTILPEEELKKLVEKFSSVGLYIWELHSACNDP